ncbi:MAG: hypothetical protein M1824_006333 [Vezdaea acicularis]|nr:MAG: hypothetical protein M1824_006333 [Vezdaea acicularis]
MAYITPQAPNTSKHRRPPAAPQQSFLYSLLPSAVSEHLHQLPSIRYKYIENTDPYMTSSSSKKSRSSLFTLHHRRPASGTRTPPPSYGASDYALTTGAAVDYSNLELFNTPSHASSSSSSLSVPTNNALTLMAPAPAPIPSETSTGIVWRFAAQGIHLLNLSICESNNSIANPTAPPSDPTAAFTTTTTATAATAQATDTSITLTRSLYIHSLTYLLRALPTDLTPSESLSLRTSLPPSITTPLTLSPTTGTSIPSPSGSGSNPAPPSLLHRLLSSLTLHLILLFSLLLPYLKSTLAHLYTYERTHRLSERLLASSLHTADSLAKEACVLWERLMGLGEGRVGDAVRDAGRWAVEGVVGGVYEGVGEGMVVLRRGKGGEGM